MTYSVDRADVRLRSDELAAWLNEHEGRLFALTVDPANATRWVAVFETEGKQ